MLDTVGNRSLFDCRRALNADGTFVTVGGGGGRWLGPAAQMLRTIAMSPFASQTMKTFDLTRDKRDTLYLSDLKNLIEAGEVVPVIDKTYPLGETPAAIQYLESGHASGKVVVTV